MLTVLAVVPVVLVALVLWASATEPRGLQGDALDTSPAARAYASAEARLFERYDVHAVTRTLTLRDPAIRVHVREVPGDDPPIVLIHGGGSSLVGFVPVLSSLEGRRLVLVDRPGCGLTDGFDYAGVDLRRHAVTFIHGVLDALGIERAAFIANSMGGLWSLWYAEEHPERVEALALVGCPALFLGTSAPTPMRVMTLPGLGQAMMRFGPSDARKNLARMAGEHAASTIDPALLEAASLGRQIPGATRSFRTLLGTALRFGGANPEYAFTEQDLSRVRAPMLLVWGSDDRFGRPSVAERARDLHSGIVVEHVAGGHLPWLDEPALVGQAIRTFLDAHRTH